MRWILTVLLIFSAMLSAVLRIKRCHPFPVDSRSISGPIQPATVK